MLNWDDVLTKAPAIVTRESGDELVVVLPEQGKFVVLNATGARMLRLTDGIRTLREIARAIALDSMLIQRRLKAMSCALLNPWLSAAR